MGDGGDVQERVSTFYGKRDHFIKEVLPNAILTMCGKEITGVTTYTDPLFRLCSICFRVNKFGGPLT